MTTPSQGPYKFLGGLVENVQPTQGLDNLKIIQTIHGVVQSYCHRIQLGAVQGTPRALASLREMEACLRFCIGDPSTHEFVGNSLRKAHSQIRDPKVWVDVMYRFFHENFMKVPKGVRIH